MESFPGRFYALDKARHALDKAHHAKICAYVCTAYACADEYRFSLLLYRFY
tara:strand:- start:212 stop:364 length:153 start_codon:yes stop_codon:yes gene_type:complete